MKKLIISAFFFLTSSMLAFAGNPSAEGYYQNTVHYDLFSLKILPIAQHLEEAKEIFPALFCFSHYMVILIIYFSLLLIKYKEKIDYN